MLFSFAIYEVVLISKSLDEIHSCFLSTFEAEDEIVTSLNKSEY